MIRAFLRRYVCDDASRMRCVSATQAQILQGISELLGQNAALTARIETVEALLEAEIRENQKLRALLKAVDRVGGDEQTVHRHNSG
jgi:hypothetical protein